MQTLDPGIASGPGAENSTVVGPGTGGDAAADAGLDGSFGGSSGATRDGGTVDSGTAGDSGASKDGGATVDATTDDGGGGCQNGFIIDPAMGPIYCTDNSGGNSPIVTQTPVVELLDGSTTMNPCDLVEQESLAIRTQYCAVCHGPMGLPAAPFHTILDDQPLADGGPTLFTQTAARQTDDAGNPVLLINPGDPYGSLLYQRVATRTMPPGPSAFGQQAPPMPTVSDIALLGAWIQTLPACLGVGSGSPPSGDGGGSSSSSSGGSSSSGSGSSSSGSGSGSSSSGSASLDTAQYNFETGVQGWAGTGAPIASVATSTAQVFAGSQSLAVNFNGAAATRQVLVNTPATPAGAVVTYHVWIPASSTVTFVQPFVQQGADGGFVFTGNRTPIANLTPAAWNTITVTVPANAQVPLRQLGVEFTTSGAFVGTVYVDSIGW